MTPDDVMQWFPVALLAIMLIFIVGGMIFAGINMWHLSKDKK